MKKFAFTKRAIEALPAHAVNNSSREEDGRNRLPICTTEISPS